MAIVALGTILASMAAAVPGVGTTAPVSTPPLIWQNVATLNVLCLLMGDRGTVTGPQADALCRSVRDLAARQAPMPVRTVTFADPAIARADAVTLLVHGNISGPSTGSTLAFYIRPYRNGENAASLLFGAMPRAARMASGGIAGAGVQTALAATLRDTLPWQAVRGGVREIAP